MTELKKALQSKILEFEALRTNPNHQTEMEQNAVLVTLRELKYLDSLAEFEPTETNTLLCDEGLKENQSVPRAVDYIKFMKEVYTPSAPNELLATEAQDTVAARGTCEHECTGPWDCQCQDVIDAFYRGVERKSSEGQL